MAAEDVLVTPGAEDLDAAELSKIELKTQEIGRSIFNHLEQQPTHIFQRRWWADRIMQWSMADEAVKIQLFRFVDVLPMLRSNDEVVDHLNEYLDEVRDRLPPSARVALGMTRRAAITRPAVARAARLSTMDFARRFIAGTNAHEVMNAVQRERQFGRGFTLDILGEAVISEVEAERFFRAYVDLLESIAPTVNGWPHVAQVDQGPNGPLPRVNLSIKLSALDSRYDAIDSEGSLRRAGQRFRELLRIAARNQAFINVDMESYETKDLTLWVFQQVLSEPEFRDVQHVGIVIQCYLRDAIRDLVALRDWARQRGTPVSVRLVKGAYWDYETVHAQAERWPIPVYQQKWQSDASFERATRFLLRNHQYLRPALGTHNIRSIAQGLAVAEVLELPAREVELQMLYGMADAEKQTLVKAGHRMRIYMPYGELIPGMAYLVRRLLENTSNDSFIRASFIERVSPRQLLRNPVEVGRELANRLERPSLPTEARYRRSASTGQALDAQAASRTAATPKGRLATDEEPLDGEMPSGPTATATEFLNEPHIDFAGRENRLAMQQALTRIRQQLGRRYPLVIGDEEVQAADELSSVNPCRFREVVGTTALATPAHVEAAVRAAQAAQPAWSALGAEVRAGYLRRAAQKMREQLFELAAWQVYECAKPWREATADVTEAIDFCDYYARQAIELEKGHAADVPGEENRFHWIPRGVTAVISPWNFPLAILTGMTTAALVTGNSVIMKPAEQSPVIAWQLMEIFRQLDLPPGVLNYLPGLGETTGAPLVEHPGVAMIAFTGSREVGLAIHAKAAEISAKPIGYVKHVLAEMGGKNAIIVDTDADLDQAVLGVVQSAFGYQGQKCSACSRAIVLEPIYDAFLERLIEATRSLPIGPAEAPGTAVSAVIDKEAHERIQRYLEIGRREAREVLSVDVRELAEQGYYIGPHIFADVPPGARIAQEEIFGPVLAVIRARDLDEALQISNGVQYGLTGGMYSRSPAHLQRARRELIVGNVYLNRTITGAIVGRQPFGGFKLSGIGTKAGGPEYLQQFVLPRVVTENTMRRGFAPTQEL